MSELLYAGKTLREVAGYDDAFMRHVLLRPRDKHGRLVRRGDLPPGVEVDEDGMRTVTRATDLETLYRRILRRRGVSPEAAEARWQEWLKDNPKFYTGGSSN